MRVMHKGKSVAVCWTRTARGTRKLLKSSASRTRYDYINSVTAAMINVIGGIV